MSAVVLSLICLLVIACVRLAVLGLRGMALSAPAPHPPHLRLHSTPLPHFSPPVYRLRRSGGGGRHLSVVH